MSTGFDEQRDRLLTGWLIRRARRSTIDSLIEFSSLITVGWLAFRTRKSTIESFRRHEGVLCKFFIQFTEIRSVTPWFFQRTWVERQMNNIHRFQKENFFINADSRSFSLTHDAHSENEMQSSFSKRELQTGDFLLTRVSLRVMKILFLLAFPTSNWRFSLIIRVSLRAYLAILFNYSRTPTSNSQKQDLAECQLVSQNSGREIAC